MPAIITYHTHTQKIPNGFKSLLTPQILSDITYRLTGQRDYVVNEITTSYNRGRLLFVDYMGVMSYVTISEKANEGRNSSLQSVPTAINLYYSDTRVSKRLCYYFIPHEGSLFTDYHVWYYKMMMTAGIQFLNIMDYAPYHIVPYTDIDLFIQERNENRGSNRGNNSSFVSRTSDRVQIYAKTYGANKYESTIIGIALSKITQLPIDLYAVAEQDLEDLPAPSKHTLNQLGVNLYQTSLRLNSVISVLPNADSLRDAAYTYNLLGRIGYKKCAICGCEIPEIIHGAHIWGVSDIKHAADISYDVKYHHATSGHNGLWLCHNHHKLFDSNLIVFSNEGDCLVKRSLPDTHIEFIQGISSATHLNDDILSVDFRNYLAIRNANINFGLYQMLA